MKQSVRDNLITMSESDYQQFSSALIPGVENMLGIRLPQLRTLAKEIAKGDWKAALEEKDYYFEESMLRGMVLSYASQDMNEILPLIAEFIPLVDNWAVCDSVFMGMNIFQKNRERAWEFIQPYLQSDKEFEIRVALIIMMQHLLKCDSNGKKIPRLRAITMESLSNQSEEKGLYLDEVLMSVDKVETSAYYASMAAAWLIAEAFCCFPYYTCSFLKKNHLDNRTHNKAIQKIIESRIPSDDVKEQLRLLKRKSD